MLAAVVLDERKEFGYNMIAGIVISMVGFSLYSEVEIRRLRARACELDLNKNTARLESDQGTRSN